MRHCPDCGHELARVHRTPVQKLFYRDVFRCPKCFYHLKRLRPSIDPARRFLFSRYTRCIRCGTPAVRRLTRRDAIDSMSRNVTSTIFWLMRAPLNKCDACRLQYYDWRPLDPSQPKLFNR